MKESEGGEGELNIGSAQWSMDKGVIDLCCAVEQTKWVGSLHRKLYMERHHSACL